MRYDLKQKINISKIRFIKNKSNKEKKQKKKNIFL